MKKNETQLSLPNAFTYWNGWLIAQKNGKDKFIGKLLLGGDVQSTKEKDPYRHKEKIITDGDYIFSLINETPDFLSTDKILREMLLQRMKEWSYQARFSNSKARLKLNKLHNALKGKLTGKKQLDIKRDMAVFKHIVKNTRKGPVNGIIDKISDEGISINGSKVVLGCDRIWQIYKEYNKLWKKCKPILKDLDTLLVFLKICAKAVNKPFHTETYKDFCFTKGEITNST